MKLLGKSKKAIHPKHLYDKKRNLKIVNLLNSFEPAKFLDIGFGAGSELITAAKHGWIAYGLDNDIKNIDLFNKRVNTSLKTKINISKHDLEITPLNIDSNSITLINFTNVLEHINNRKAILLEIERILTNEGICLISIPNKDTLWKRIQRFAGVDSRDDFDHKIEYSLEEIFNEIKESNLRISSEMDSIVPSFPFDGILSLSAIISPSLFRFTQQFKRTIVKKNIIDTIGWSFEVKKMHIKN